MEYKIINKESYNIHMIKTDKFKTLFFRVVLSEKLKKEDITIRNLLIDNLMYSCKKYPTMKEMNIKKQDLYGADVIMSNRRVGDHIYSEYVLSMLDPTYTEPNMFEETLDFYKEILFNPNVSNECFNEEIFNLCKNNLKNDILMTSERPDKYGFNRFKEVMDNNAEFSYNLDGDLEELEKITNKSLYDYYKKMMKNNVDIFVVGDIDKYNIEQTLEKNFKFNGKKEKEKSEVTLSPKRNTINEVIEESKKYNQTKLYIASRLDQLTNHEKKYEMIIYNIILGNSPESKFFLNIREKYSLAYFINSGFRRLDNIFYITSGISFNNYHQVLKLIKENMCLMETGEFTDEDIEKAKKIFISAFKDIFEGSSSIVDYYMNVYYFGSDDVDIQIKEIEKMTREDIKEVANKIKIDTIYVLKEGK